MKRLVLGMFLVSHAAAHTVPLPLTPDDFAFGYDITLDDTAAIYRLPLPQEVYRHIAHADLSDLRVFNAAGEPVPHTRRRAGPDPSPEGTAAELPFFPLPSQTGDPNRPLSVQVTRDAQGAVVRVEDRVAVARNDRPGAYLIDTSQLERPPDALELGWTGAQANFVAGIRIAGSDDLVRWRTLVGQASVARLLFAGRLLERTRIEIPRKTFRYLRLDWPSDVGTAKLTGVTGWFREPLPDVLRGWVELEGTPVEGDKPIFDYELRGHAPVDRVGVALPPGNVLIAAAISSRDGDSEWRDRYRGIFYRVTVDGAELIEEDAGIATTRAPHWRIELESDAAITAAPRLRLGWALDDLYFLARGDGPYTLAYGAAGALPEQTAVDELLSRLDGQDAERFTGMARASEPRTLGGEARLKPAPAPLPWDRILLWGVLLIGAAGLGVMAWRLWRQMRETPSG